MMKKDTKQQHYFIYILRCADDTLYIGSTNDVKKRELIHNTSPAGARYTKARRPVRVVYSERHATKSTALKRECELKRLTRSQKLIIINVDK